MDLRTHCQTMSRYHAWAFRRLFQQIHRLDDADYRADRGLFFGSVHGTLNHLLLADRLWLARCLGESFPVEGLDQELVSDRDELEDAILDSCERWREYLEEAPDTRFQETMDYTNTKGEAIRLPFSQIVLHVFNHGSHHRGQVSAALTAAGLDAPVMDLIYFSLDERT